ncbi:uncharacterized protein LOC130998151 [Salvia miltiorrhiza]|uniref:uncharacterized protein LOC130998151 n=1 Tax=Salvia miltiorrhiza TaxID=226208 RepID=UPI0025AB8023|nr:uncharacterized protein LOC130998151 [Salvia miltiorrhiza]
MPYLEAKRSGTNSENEDSDSSIFEVELLQNKADSDVQVPENGHELDESEISFVDSEFVENLDSRKSQIGNLFNLFGCAISWKSRLLQSVFALSITEAEYMGLTEAVKEVMWLKGLLENWSATGEDTVSKKIVQVLKVSIDDNVDNKLNKALPG